MGIRSRRARSHSKTHVVGFTIAGFFGFMAMLAVAGALSAAFKCTSPAPHGGFWVIAIIGNPVMYFAALAIGSIVGCLILSLLKKPLSPEESGLAK